ncbi:uncharacterized protein C8R40DRAFT_235054 [Lentinula edodes]|uniref:uncharacterized protein n=1 Tax=Lentinula edodes TaxID=5353 RepID=UPI001E8DA8AD|nr:uncharacterized protein C8R40DRAFT_235054 [Lentinula edodes]KAH7874899.1 hypothetical protein C8R40DRAFT_235054 [Lentinula edodes]
MLQSGSFHPQQQGFLHPVFKQKLERRFQHKYYRHMLTSPTPSSSHARSPQSPVAPPSLLSDSSPKVLANTAASCTVSVNAVIT